MKIVSVVPNSAVKDARVVKQARTLVANGHEVVIIGVQDKVSPSYMSVVDDTIIVYRENIQTNIARWRLYIRCAVFFALSVCFITAVASLYYSAQRASVLAGREDFDLFSALSGHSAALIVLICLPPLILVFRRYFLKKDDAVSRLLKKYRNRVQFLINTVLRGLSIRKMQALRICETRPDIIYCHEAMSLPACALAKQRLDVPLIYDAHEFYDDVTGTNSHIMCRFYKRIHRTFIKEVDLFVTVTPTILEAYYKHYPNLTRRSVVLWNSVAQPVVKDYDGRLHARAGLPRERKILLYQGGITLKRKVDQVAQAARHLPADWSVVLMGSAGHDLDTVSATVAQINADHERAQFLGRLTPELNAELAVIAQGYFDQTGTNTKPADTTVPRGVRTALTKHLRDNGTSLSFLATHSNQRFKRALTKRTNNRLHNGSKTKADRGADRFNTDMETIWRESEAIAAFQQRIHEERWRLAKELALTDLIHKNAHAQPVVPRVVLLAQVPQSELVEWTRGATIGAIPYPISSLNHWGCGPNKLWEYPSAGVPIIATPANEIRKIVEHYKIGWIMPADPTARNIAEVIEKLSDADIARAKENCARFMADSNWTIHSAQWINRIRETFSHE